MSSCPSATSSLKRVAVTVEQPFVVLHLEIDRQALLKPAVEVDQVRIGVVQQRALRQQAERDGQAAAERLDQPRRACAAQSGRRCGTCHRLPPAHFRGGRRAGCASTVGMSQVYLMA